MAQSLSKNLIHLIFSTKNRMPYITDSIRGDLHAYLSKSLDNLECPVLLINSVEDHIHILFSLHRKISLSSVVGKVKASSSKWIKTQEKGYNSFAWQSGFAAFSVSQSNVDAVLVYISKQKEHHAKISYQDEFLMFIKKYKIEYDDRYIWD